MASAAHIQALLRLSMTETLTQRVTRHEGLRLKPYTDTAGKITIGVGHNLTDDGLTLAQVENLLQDDLQAALDSLLRALPWVGTLTPLRREVFTELAFNLGLGGLLSFHGMIEAAADGDWLLAGQRLLASEYATQVGDRAHELAQLLQ
jgi:lysozyme